MYIGRLHIFYENTQSMRCCRYSDCSMLQTCG